LNPHQRYFVSKGRNFHISADHEENEKEIKKDEEHDKLIEAGYDQNEGYRKELVEEMVNRLDPETYVDRKIISRLIGKDLGERLTQDGEQYGVTGRRMTERVTKLA
jgi:hypothetical protein